MLSRSQWVDELSLIDLNGSATKVMWDNFKEQMQKVIEKYVPLSSKKDRRHAIPLDKETRDLIEQKDKMSRKITSLQKQRKSGELAVIEPKYSKLRNKIRKNTRIARKAYESSIASNVKEHPKVVFRYMNSKTKLRPGIGKLCTDPSDPSSKTTDIDEEKANILSKYFASVQTKEPKGKIPELPKRQITTEMEPLIITEEKVLELLINLNATKSYGIDEFSPRFLKEIAAQIVKPVTKIFQLSLLEAQIPQDWLTSIITAIFKKGAKCLAENYRPVSLTCILCKCMEKLVRNHIVEHMMVNNLFSARQYGFLAKRSTTLQLLKALEDWTEALEQGKEMDVIYTDFQKAFDKVPHERLLKKMEAYGISKEIINWTRVFITKRRQRVMVNGTASTWEEVTSGVPQGSVLGPILFVIYINDLPDSVLSNLLLFADDSKVYKSIANVEDRTQLQTDLHSMYIWSEKWLLYFHPDKLKYLKICTGRKEDQSRVYYVGDHRVANTECEKDLGIEMDQTLRFKQHIAAKVKTANSMVGAIRRSFRYLDIPTFRLLYKGLSRCHLEYAVPTWSPSQEKLIEQIESVQRRATAMLSETKGMTYSERLRRIGLPTLRYRRLRADMIETHKMLHNEYDMELCPKLILRKSMIKTPSRTNSLALYHNRNVNETRRNFFSQRIIGPWNSLPDHVAGAPSRNSFKERLDKHWRNQEIVYNHKMPLKY